MTRQSRDTADHPRRRRPRARLALPCALLALAAAPLAAQAPGAGAAQGGVPGEEHHYALTADHQAVAIYAQALARTAGRGRFEPAVAREFTEAMRRDLDRAAMHHHHIDSTLTAAGTTRSKAEHAAVMAHHEQADSHLKMLEAEVQKSSPDAKGVQQHAQEVARHVQMAEQEHAKAQKVLGVAPLPESPKQ